jgi:two-component system response regulator RegA
MAMTDALERHLLIVDDDKPFLTRLARAMEARGYVVVTADSVDDGLACIERAAPAFAVRSWPFAMMQGFRRCWELS